MKLKTNKTSIKGPRPKIKNKKMIEIEIPTTKRVKLYYSGKESENKGKKRFIGDKPYHYR